MTAAVSLTDVGVRLGGRAILGGVNAEIRPGEFVGVFGPNGAGKSTLMRCLLGLVAPAAGRVSVLGAPPGRLNRDIGYLPQARTDLGDTALSARALVAAVEGGNRWGAPFSSRASRGEIDRVLALAGASPYAHRPFSRLSGGEKQRVMLAGALIGTPRLLILDEPLAGLDPRNQVRLIESVARIKASTGVAVLLVAHDLNPLVGVMDRAWYVAGGKALIGATDEVISGKVLSALYDTEIEVVRAGGRIFILAAGGSVLEASHHD